ncbi:unnamed protein product [Polarella glacialis]|uniref:Glycosyltransferase 2-like domain-containing protein n=1 Tax=Polarella glacialis TaxID=89957 RepID=A0A813F5C4_POLGL|nr:unnamed protein product [Polarella glacialis]
MGRLAPVSNVRLSSLRVLLFVPVPILALLSNSDELLVAILAVSSVVAVVLDALRQRMKCMPFPVLVLLVSAGQLSCYVAAGQHGTASLPGLAEQAAALRGPGQQTAVAANTKRISTMSIVMAAYNEHQYMKRTLDSIIESTPPEVLLEIIVVDDGSDPPLKPLTEGYSLVKVLRHEERRGLIKSKTEGGNMATADMIMFLDAHVKPEQFWYRPLLRHMNVNYKRVVVPLIPILDAKTWIPNNRAVGVKMMFDWSLHFRWFDNNDDLVPCMSGGLFGITRQWWHESGEYDYGMNAWGAENIEQSIRIWLCGGEIYVARDSRVAHVFRSKFPYSINNTEVYINKIRTVEAWFDDFKNQYYQADPAAKTLLPLVGDISERLALKTQMQCKPFSWYIEKFKDVFVSKNMLPPQMFLIRDASTQLCVAASAEESLAESSCDEESKSQRWTVLMDHQHQGIKHMGSSKCLNEAGSQVTLQMCVPEAVGQGWALRNGYVRRGSSCLEGKDTGELDIKSCGGFLQRTGPFEYFGHRFIT